MANKKLIGFWAFFDFCLLAAGIIAIVFAVLWNISNDPLRNLVITHHDTAAGLGLGVLLIITFVISIGAIVQPNHVTLPLAILNWALLLDSLATVAIGTVVWWATLEERLNFGIAFNATDDATKQILQDTLQCCGYFFPNETGNVIEKGFCGTSQRTNATGCVTPVTAFADSSLNDIFTTIYGFAAVIIGLFVATLCVIKTRHETERFRRIDAKRGGRGFV